MDLVEEVYRLSEGNLIKFIDIKIRTLRALNKAFEEIEKKMIEDLLIKA